MWKILSEKAHRGIQQRIFFLTDRSDCNEWLWLWQIMLKTSHQAPNKVKPMAESGWSKKEKHFTFHCIVLVERKWSKTNFLGLCEHSSPSSMETVRLRQANASFFNGYRWLYSAIKSFIIYAVNIAPGFDDNINQRQRRHTWFSHSFERFSVTFFSSLSFFNMNRVDENEKLMDKAKISARINGRIFIVSCSIFIGRFSVSVFNWVIIGDDSFFPHSIIHPKLVYISFWFKVYRYYVRLQWKLARDFLLHNVNL